MSDHQVVTLPRTAETIGGSTGDGPRSEGASGPSRSTATPAPAGGTKRAAVVAVALLTLSGIGGGFLVGRATAPSDTVSQIGGSATGATKVSGGAAEDAAALVEQGLALHVAGKLDDAVGMYRRALELDASNKYATFNLGQIAHTRGELPAAIRYYNDTLKVDATYVPALYNLGLAYSASGDAKQAIATLRAASNVAPTDAKVLFNLGKLLVADGKSDEGNNLLVDAGKLDPSLQITTS